MRVGVVGAGFVGKAVINALTCDVEIADPAVNGVSVQDLDFSGLFGVFVCVPTPMAEDGSVDPSYVYEVVRQIPKDTLTIIKSTITPEHLLILKAEGRRIVFNPEFLTQRSANVDFLEPDSLIFGGDQEDCHAAHKIYAFHSKVNPAPVFYTDLATATLVKYALNCHFAAKVIFMNELHALHAATAESSWEEFTDILAADTRLGPSHLQVPGPDGYMGYGGACFPKDTNALVTFAQGIGLDLSVLRQAIETNKQIRDE